MSQHVEIGGAEARVERDAHGIEGAAGDESDEHAAGEPRGGAVGWGGG